SESGYMHKAVLLRRGVHVVEEVQVFKQPQPVRSMKLSVAKGLIYVGTSEGVVRIPTANCSFYWTCPLCVLARDPFCGWDAVGRACVEAAGNRTNIGQDIDGGNVEEVCNGLSLRCCPNKLPAGSCPAGQLVSVSLNEVVRLQCPTVSRLSLQTWERPNSLLSPDLYLHLEDGSLSFVATPTTLGHYLCLSAENGYEQTMAVYDVKQKTSRMAQAPPTANTWPLAGPTPATTAVTGPGPRSGLQTAVVPKRTETKREKAESTVSNKDIQVTRGQLGRNTSLRTSGYQGGEPLLSFEGPCYLTELVVVSVLLGLCLSLLITVLLYVIRQRCHRRTSPQVVAPTRESDRSTPTEQESIRGNQPLSKRSGQASGLLSNGALAGSNGHLPNIPV
ncbi:semaphorin-4B-like, partial [Brachionichthys hirsutus]|uniref:semaphorin-4B-like n=1 Tax=Brachionichthys hirsutus TaxID=412623 RepID=UPI0036051D22